jgi:biopolymer transport protein ExbD
MNLRKRSRRKPGTGVLLSPLIDCVFLLLIFFLVTSMIKRFERQIPVTLADDTSAITTEPFDDSYPIGVDQTGRLYGPTGKQNRGVTNFARLGDSEKWLQNLIRTRGAHRPVTIVVEKGTPFQKVINIQDRLETIGFTTIRFRIRDFGLGGEIEVSREIERPRDQ